MVINEPTPTITIVSGSTNTITTCRYCTGGGHTPERCPSVKTIHYRKDGTIKSVEKVTAADYMPRFDPQPVTVGDYPPYRSPYIWSGSGYISSDKNVTYTVHNSTAA